MKLYFRTRNSGVNTQKKATPLCTRGTLCLYNERCVSFLHKTAGNAVNFVNILIRKKLFFLETSL